MTHFNIGPWLVQFGLHGGEWTTETFLVVYEGEPKWHRVFYLGPLCLSIETD